VVEEKRVTLNSVYTTQMRADGLTSFYITYESNVALLVLNGEFYHRTNAAKPRPGSSPSPRALINIPEPLQA
jgi:hypothetical protein